MKAITQLAEYLNSKGLLSKNELRKMVDEGFQCPPSFRYVLCKGKELFLYEQKLKPISSADVISTDEDSYCLYVEDTINGRTVEEQVIIYGFELDDVSIQLLSSIAKEIQLAHCPICGSEDCCDC